MRPPTLDRSGGAAFDGDEHSHEGVALLAEGRKKLDCYEAPHHGISLFAVRKMMDYDSSRLTLLACACALEATCYTLCVPFLTFHLNEHFGLSVSDAGLVLIAYSIGSICSTPFVEMITCQLGGSGSVCGGLLLLALSQLCFALSRSLPCLLATRFVGGFAGGVIWAAVLALCHVLSLRRGERAGAAAACERESLAGHVHTSHHARGGGGDGMGALYGTVLSSVSYGTTIGAPLGGALYSAGGWALPLGCTVVLCVLSAAALALLLPHEGALTPTADEDKSGLSRSSWLGLASWRLASVLCLVLCGAMLFSSVDAVLPAQLRRRYGQTSLQTSLVFFVMSVFYGLSAPAFGVLADRSGKALHVSMAGLLGLALLLPVFALPLPHWALIPVAMLFGTSATAQLTPASSLLTSVASAEVRRSPPLAYAMFNTAYTLGLALGPAALGALTELFSFQQASACLSGCALALAGCSALFIASLDTRGEEHQMLRTASQPHTPGPSPRPGPIDARTEEEAEGDEATSAREGLLSSAAVDEQQHEHPR